MTPYNFAPSFQVFSPNAPDRRNRKQPTSFPCWEPPVFALSWPLARTWRLQIINRACNLLLRSKHWSGLRLKCANITFLWQKNDTFVKEKIVKLMATRNRDRLCLRWANAEWKFARSRRGVTGVNAVWESARSQRCLRFWSESSIRWHSGIWGAADEAVLNKVHKKILKTMFWDSARSQRGVRVFMKATSCETLLSLSQCEVRFWTESAQSDRSFNKQRCQQCLARFG